MIDEKRLIERFKKLKGADVLVNIFISAVIREIKKQPQIGGWIPCSERLPECGKRYLVTAIWRDGEFERRSVYDAVYGSDRIWHTRNFKSVAYEVAAWQPLPEPYKGEEIGGIQSGKINFNT